MTGLDGVRTRLCVGAIFLLACGGEVVPQQDSGGPGFDSGGLDGSSSTLCLDDGTCDDGTHCNGAETCDPSNASAAPDGCVAGTPPCTSGQICSEEERRCVSTECEPPMNDMDGDGAISIDCGGSDCDDGDAQRFPGNTEICDASDHDEDCDPTTFGVRDADSDGEPDASCCNLPMAGDPICGTDCDDARAGVSPVATETCDERDNDCDGATDEDVLHTYYPDADGDGYGDPAATPVMGCFLPAMHSELATDCDDMRAGTHPGLDEACDAEMRDENCDGVANPPMECNCTDGTSQDCTEPGVCSSGRQVCAMGTWGACSIRPTAETCNRLDDNCDGATDEGLTVVCYADADNDGYPGAGVGATSECPDPARTTVGGCPSFTTNRAPSGGNVDCADTDPTRRPFFTETCNAIDDDCDGAVDEALRVACWTDGDNDGYAPSSATVTMQCPASDRPSVGGCPLGTTDRTPAAGTTDCNDSVATYRPGGTEICTSGPAADEDCDGATDEGVAVACYADTDGDTYAAMGATVSMQCRDDGRPTLGFCPISYTDRAPAAMAIDCAPTNAAIHPAADEVCDMGMVDENCDGAANPMSLCTCTNGMTQACPEAGVCGGGTRSCSGGMWGPCSISPTPEICDGRDEDCDGTVDDGLRVTCYADADGDTYAAAMASAMLFCPDPSRSEVGGCPVSYTDREPADMASIDCGPSSSAIRPGAMEVCDTGAVDDDCDGIGNDGCTCTNGSTRACLEPGVCAMGSQTCVSGAWGACSVSPTPETCDSSDEDCDGTVDEGVRVACYADTDNDTYATMGASSSMQCPDALRGAVGFCPISYTNRAAVDASTSDCAPTSASVHPLATETCNAQDEDCDGSRDETFTCVQSSSQSCASACGTTGTQTCRTDCGGWTTCVASEVCNGCDDDVDGSIDDGYACPRGSTRSCTTSCGTPGSQNCAADCGGWSICLAAGETCNYCDDNGVSSYHDERSLATSTYRISPNCSQLRGVGLHWAWCFDDAASATRYRRIRDTPDPVDSATGAWFPSHNLGWGTLEIVVDMNAWTNGSVAADGWALIIADGGSGDLGTATGLGVPYGRTGLAIEWRYRKRVLTGGSTDVDTITVRRLTGSGIGDTLGSADVPDATMTLEAGEGLVSQRLLVQYTPDDPTLSGSQERLEVRTLGAASPLLSYTGVLPFGTLFNEIEPNSRVDVGITAGTTTSGVGNDVRLHQLRIIPPPTEYTYARHTGVCP